MTTAPRTAMPHTRAASVLGVELGNAFDRGRSGPGGWLMLDEPELHFANDVLVPDLAGWRRTRLPSLPNEAYLTLAPLRRNLEALALATSGFEQIEEHSGDSRVRACPFDAVELELQALWST